MNMKIRTIKHFTKEAFSGIWRNKLMTLASISTVSSCLIIFGIFILLSTNLNFIAKQLEETLEIKAFIDENTPENQVEQIGLSIARIEYVNGYSLETKEEALENYKKRLGDEAYVLEGFEKVNPLRYSYNIRLTDINHSNQVEQELYSIKGIVKVTNHKEVINRLLSITTFIRSASFWIMVILAAIAIFIISNTIKLTVFARRKEINIMKFVGATNSFIRWPFIIEGMLIGLIGAIISLIIVAYGYDNSVKLISNDQYIKIFELKSLEEIIEGIALIFLLLGGSIGAIGSAISIRKYLYV